MNFLSNSEKGVYELCQATNVFYATKKLKIPALK